MSLEDNKGDAASRSKCYEIFSELFYQPNKEELLSKKILFDLVDALTDLNPDAKKSAERMNNSISEYEAEQLIVEYSRLFVGPFKVLAPPYGSVYIDSGRILMGDSTLDIIHIYREAGLVFRERFKEVPDHITIELEFLHFITYKELAALHSNNNDDLKKYRKTQVLFMNNFFGKWIFPFCEHILSSTENSYYRNLAECLQQFTRSEMERINNFSENILGDA